MRINADFTDIRVALDEAFREIGRDTRDAVKDATIGLKEELRGQVLAAGMSRRLANTWRSDIYKNDPDGLDTAGLVFSKAPDIMSSFARGVTVYPTGGRHYLWLPTKNVPRRRGRAGSQKAMAPRDVEREFRQKLVIRSGPRGHLLAFVTQERGMTKGGKVRRARKGRIAVGTREMVLMFTLVPLTKPRRLFNLKAAGEKWSQRIATQIEGRR